MTDEPDWVQAARATIADWNKIREGQRRLAEKARNATWHETHVGQRFEVDVEGSDPWDTSDRHHVKFTAILVSADKNEGDMVWDNGVETKGVWLGDPLPAAE